jgi:hypothetical protein
MDYSKNTVYQIQEYFKNEFEPIFEHLYNHDNQNT